MAKYVVKTTEDADVRELKSAVQATGVLDVTVHARDKTITFDGDESDADSIRELEGVASVTEAEEGESAEDDRPRRTTSVPAWRDGWNDP